MEERDGVKVISVAEMREADARTIAGGTPGAVLMKRAAQGVFDSVEKLGPGWRGRTLVVTGSGNNGGDGYALASIMADKGLDVTLLRVSEKLSEDGGKYYEECREKGVPEITLEDAEIISGGADEGAAVQPSTGAAGSFDVIVDCVLGTGFDGEPRGAAKDAIMLINRLAGRPVAQDGCEDRVSAGDDGTAAPYIVSVDINSGMNGDTGEAVLAVKSDLTVSIGFYKHGFFRGRADELIGKLTNVDIGIEL